PSGGERWRRGWWVHIQAVGRLSRCRSRGVAWPNTRPCQGRERRFESGQDRQGPEPRRSLERWPSPVEGDGLENRYGSLAHREFKSLLLRQSIWTSPFCLFSPSPSRHPPSGQFGNQSRHLIDDVAEDWHD